MAAQPAVQEIIVAAASGQPLSDGTQWYPDPETEDRLAGLLFHAEMDRLEETEYPTARNAIILLAAAGVGLVTTGQILVALIFAVAAAFTLMWVDAREVFSRADEVSGLAIRAATGTMCITPSISDDDIAALCDMVSAKGLAALVATVDPDRN